MKGAFSSYLIFLIEGDNDELKMFADLYTVANIQIQGFEIRKFVKNCYKLKKLCMIKQIIKNELIKIFNGTKLEENNNIATMFARCLHILNY